MMNWLAFEVVNRHLKDVYDNENAFRGKQVIFREKFRWIIPVVTHDSRKSIIVAIVHQASFWNDCHVMHFCTSMRLQRADQSSETTERMEEFAGSILQVSEGEVQRISILEDGESN